MNQHSISWFEIPTSDLERATKFYEAVFDVSLAPMDTPNLKMRIFPVADFMTGVSGALVYSNGFHIPSSSHGPLLYLNANPDVQHILDRIESNGGQIIVPKTMISPENGFMAAIIDTEGNRIGLHSIS